MESDFTKKLLRWNKTLNHREMPWKKEKDPYRIWLSEIILQQTRVEQGRAYYERFLQHFPTIMHLAAAPEKLVFKLWEGLGYYTRCRNLIATAKKITEKTGGRFPGDYNEILSLPGIGPYTAAAIASFAFGLPHPVVDGNVHRVLSRYFGISTPMDSAKEKAFYHALAQSLLHKKDPAAYNQAIMDFGATVCKPRQPLCSICIQSAECQAYENGWVDQLPVRKKKGAKKERWFFYLLIENNRRQVYIRQRTEKDIWENLYEFVLIETDKPMKMAGQTLTRLVKRSLGDITFTVTSRSPVFQQQLTHQTVNAQFIHLHVQGKISTLHGFQLIPKKSLSEFAFPRMIARFLSQHEQASF